MATDINAAKSALASDGSLPSVKTTAQNSIPGIDFGDIIRKSGSRLDNGLNLLSDRAGITGVSERIDNTPAPDDYSYDENDSRNNNARNWDNSDDNTDQGQERNISDNSDYNVDYDDNNTQNYKSETQEASSDKSANNKNQGENKQHDDRADNNGDSSRQADSDDSSPEQSSGTESNETSGSEAAEKSSNKEILGNLISIPQANTLTGHSSSRNTKKNSMLPGDATGQMKTNNQNNLEGKNSAAGIKMAVSDASIKINSNSANNGQPSTNSQNTLAQGIGHNLSNTQGQVHTQSANNTELLAAAGAQENISKKANEQAAQLSKMVGSGKKIDISVAVTDEKSTLVSKPTANLASSTILAADTSAASLRSQQGKGAGNANASGQSQQASEQIAGATGQVQQALGTQAQSTNAASTNNKGTAQVNLHAVSSQGTPTGNGETPLAASPNNISATQQAQQNTSTQAANSARFTTANHAVVEQVSIQISKALNAGNDKISIQLKPADLGRVDVQMEVGHDGRVTAVVTADNKQTLDLLQKDSKQLQEALQQAGLQADDDSLDFNLREQDDGKEMAESDDRGTIEGAGDELTLEEELAGIKPNIITDTRVDVRA